MRRLFTPNWDRGFVFYHPPNTMTYRKIAIRDQHGNWAADNEAIAAHNLGHLKVPELCLTANEIS